MALQSLAGGLLRWPEFHMPGTTVQAETIDANGESFAFVLWTPASITVRGVNVFVWSVAASGDLDVTVEGVSAGLPDGTPVATKTATVSSSGTNKITFDSDVSVAAGFFAVRFKRTSGTLNAVFQAWIQNQSQYPAHLISVGGALSSGVLPLVSLYSGTPPSETYIRLPYNWAQLTGTSNYGAGTNGHQEGASVAVPFRCRAVGITFMGYQNATPSAYPTVHLYDAGNVELASGTFDNIKGDTTLRPLFVPFSSPVTLTAATYYMAVQTNDAANDVALSHYNTSDAGVAAAMGLSGRLNRASAAAAWTEYAGYIPMALVLDRLDDGVVPAGAVVFASARAGARTKARAVP